MSAEQSPPLLSWLKQAAPCAIGPVGVVAFVIFCYITDRDDAWLTSGWFDITGLIVGLVLVTVAMLPLAQKSSAPNDTSTH